MSHVNIKQFLTVLAAMGLLLVVSSCQNDASLDSQFSLDELRTDAFAVVDYYDVDANIQDATIDANLSMNPVFKTSSGFRRHAGYRGGKGGHLGQILRQLGITEEQGAGIKELVKAHRESVKASFEALRAVNQDIIDDAKSKRKEILDAMRIGTITREEAKEQLKAFSQSKREAIANNPESAPHIEAICSAKVALFESIRTLFAGSQQSGWDDWVAGLEGICFGS